LPRPRRQLHLYDVLISDRAGAHLARRSELLGPFSGTVEYAQDFDGVVVHPVWDDVWRPTHYQLAGAGDTAWAA